MGGWRCGVVVCGVVVWAVACGDDSAYPFDRAILDTVPVQAVSEYGFRVSVAPGLDAAEVAQAIDQMWDWFAACRWAHYGERLTMDIALRERIYVNPGTYTCPWAGSGRCNGDYTPQWIVTIWEHDGQRLKSLPHEWRHAYQDCDRNGIFGCPVAIPADGNTERPDACTL